MYVFEDLRREGLPIRQFKIVQTSATEIEIQIVAATESQSDDLVRAVQSRARKALPDMAAVVAIVPLIPRTPSGKMQVIENRWLKGSAR